MRVIFSTERGLEGFLAESLRGAGEVSLAPFGFRGRVELKGIGERKLLEVLYTNPFYHRCTLIFEVASISKDRAGLEAVYETSKKSRLVELFSPEKNFAVRGFRKGNHAFRSAEVSAYCGAALIDACRAKKGFRPVVNLSDPDIIVTADVVDETFVLGLELVGDESMHKRRWHVFHHHASLKTTIANALIRLCGDPKRMVLLDPMCGSGTIPIEAAHRAIDLPPAFFRKNEFSFLKTGLWKSQWEETTQKIDEKINWQYSGLVFGSDRSAKSVEGATLNAKAARVEGRVVFIHSAVENLSRFLIQAVDAFAVNPPYGIRLGSPRKMRRSMEALFQSFAESSAIVMSIIHPDAELVSELSDRFGLLVDKKIHAYNGNLEAFLFRIIKL